MWKVYDDNGRFILRRDDGLTFMRLHRNGQLVRRSWPSLVEAQCFCSSLNLVNA